MLQCIKVEHNVVRFLRTSLETEPIFMQDNTHIYCKNGKTIILSLKKIQVMARTPRSSDLYPTENLRKVINDNVQRKKTGKSD